MQSMGDALSKIVQKHENPVLTWQPNMHCDPRPATGVSRRFSGVSPKTWVSLRKRKISPKRKFWGGYPCGHPAENFGQALQILEKEAFWHGHPTRTSMKKLRSEKLRADFSFPNLRERTLQERSRGHCLDTPELGARRALETLRGTLPETPRFSGTLPKTLRECPARETPVASRGGGGGRKACT